MKKEIIERAEIMIKISPYIVLLSLVGFISSLIFNLPFSLPFLIIGLSLGILLYILFYLHTC